MPAAPAELALRALELARLSPLAEWHYRTAHKDSFVSIDRARTLLGWEPRLSNAETLCATYDWYLAHRDELRGAGTTHRVPWDQQALGAAEAARLTRPPDRRRPCRGLRCASMRELLDYRSEFPILEHTTYLINHSLAAMPRQAEERLARVRAHVERARDPRRGARAGGRCR